MANLEYISLLASLLFIQVTWSKDVTLKYSPLVEHLKATADPEIIPLSESQTEPLEVSVKISLLNLLEVDKENNEVEVVVWEQLQWKTTVLAWNPAEYNNATHVRLHYKSVWIPDLMVYNSVHEPEVISPKVVVVTSEGSVVYVPSVRLRFSCDLYTVQSPSGAECTMKFGSWTYHTNLLSLTSSETHNFDLSEYTGHPRHSIIKTTSKKSSKKYDCCPETYDDFEFTMTIREREFSSSSHDHD